MLSTRSLTGGGRFLFENCWQAPESKSNEVLNLEISYPPYEPWTYSLSEELFFSYPEQRFTLDLEENEPERELSFLRRNKFVGWAALSLGIVGAAFSLYLLTKTPTTDQSLKTSISYKLIP